MKKIVFSSDDLAENLNNKARFKLWNDIYTSHYGEADISCHDTPFLSRTKFGQLGDIGLVECSSTIQRYARDARQIVADQREDFLIGFSRCQSPKLVVQRGREAPLVPGGMIIYTNGEPSTCFCEGQNNWSGLSVPRARLRELVAGVDDLAGKAFGAGQPAVRHLQRYVEFLLGSEEVGEDPALIERVRNSVFDLVVLALGGKGDAAEIARGRGLRAARVQEILSEIGARFSEPAFSAHVVAQKLGLSPRYVQELMHDTGVTFTERILELRLQKAREMLIDPRHDRLRIGDIAYASGFNEVSYFNRCFRRRFGYSPKECRGG
jgi:AraC-like DNA-binding protein